jgi:hypothetical protein
MAVWAISSRKHTGRQVAIAAIAHDMHDDSIFDFAAHLQRGRQAAA